uniref:TBC1 domain family member 5 n=1 Tax=Gadus morhua TaxID=8049 RepID=A0A8C4ZZQ6_GADMO
MTSARRLCACEHEHFCLLTGGSLDSSTYSQSQATFLSYRREWDDLFLNSNYLARTRQAGISGRLRSSRFRSVCWKKVSASRRSKGLQSNILLHITNPRKAAGQQDLVVNNPLSQDEGSLWNKFFQDKELRSMIRQDVMRTFPEMRYFQEEDVRTKLTDILFCYARENEQLLYKQGMHELLAPIVFVLHCDHQAFQHASETANPSAMFSQLMETTEPWFSSFERQIRKGKEEMLTTIPFARPQDTGPSVAIVTKVNRIQDQLVKKHDVELHMHVNRLEIAPQIYGIRWVRLLFGREFPLQDLLVVWDALFADSITLDLVDYIFVAMLLYIRDALIASNFQTCLGLLMHYPPIGDIHSLLHKALFLRDPKNNPRPFNYQFQQNLDYYKTRGADLVDKTRAKAPPLNINKVSSSLLNFGRKLISPAVQGSPAVFSPINTEVHSSSFTAAAAPPPPPPRPLLETLNSQGPEQHPRLLKSESMPAHLSKGQRSRAVSSSPSVESLGIGGDASAASPPLSASRKESFFNITRSRSHSKSMGKKDNEEDLEAQVSFLQGQINDLEAMSKYCAKMMNTHICKIQDVILQEHIEKEDEVLVSLAGLKQIKDILKGALRFNQSQLEAEENEEISIADDHYTIRGRRRRRGGGREGGGEGSTGPHATRKTAAPEGKHFDDYILVSQEGELPAPVGGSARGGDIGEGGGGSTPPVRRGRGSVRLEPEGLAGGFQDPLIACVVTSGSSSPDEGSTNSKDSDFTIVNPNDL